MNKLEELLGEVRLEHNRHLPRLSRHVLAQLVCLGTHTVTGLLNVCGEQFRDWSAHYRMYGRDRADPQRLFDVVRKRLCAVQHGPIVAALDDTKLRKTGKKVYGAKYTRDPMGPPFHVNFVLAQRFLQTSIALKGPEGQARMIPVDWVHAPVPQKPSKKATEEQTAQYQQLRKQARIGIVGATRLAQLRQWMDQNQESQRPLWAVVDGSFTNGTFLKDLPQNTAAVGRIRADAKLYHLPERQLKNGRRRVYGDRASTPEQLRQDDGVPWETIDVYFGGQLRSLKAKRITPVRWRAAGEKHTLQLIVVAPTPYRLSPHAKLLYRQPAYLVCTDPNAPLQQIVQHYIWRWDIEVNFRDEKTILGTGQAQVREPHAVQNVTATAVAAYAMLTLAAELCRQEAIPTQHLPAPKWQRKKVRRATTMNLIQNLRHELWGRSIHFSSFVNNTQTNTKPQKYNLPLNSALFYATTYS